MNVGTTYLTLFGTQCRSILGHDMARRPLMTLRSIRDIRYFFLGWGPDPGTVPVYTRQHRI